jgi:hypothetical protein
MGRICPMNLRRSYGELQTENPAIATKRKRFSRDAKTFSKMDFACRAKSKIKFSHATKFDPRIALLPI